MKIQDLIENILKGSQYLGTFTLPDLVQFAATRTVNGLAVAKETEKEYYLAFAAGEPEGAIYIDEKGTLYGDKAVMMITGHEKFVLCDVSSDLVEAVVMGCRIFDKSHIRKSITYVIPEIGRKSAGMGILTLTVRRETAPRNGVRVSIRKDGKIVGSDIATEDGTVSFKVMYGEYDCIVQDRNQMLTTFHVPFDENNSKVILDL